MNKKITAISAIAAIVFDLIACIGDSNPVVYRVFMVLCCAAFCIFVYGLFRIEFANTKVAEAGVISDDSYTKAA